MANGSVAKAVSKPKGEGVFARLVKFLKEAWYETFHKSAWPSWTELRQFTVVVIFALIAVAVYIGVIDFVLARFTEWLSGGR